MMNGFLHLLGIAFSGALGTAARFGVNHGASALWGTSHPWGTTIVNLLGCFLFGLASGLIAHECIPAHWKNILLTGFLGGFTTFSAFAFENQQFLLARRWDGLAIHLIGQNVLGVVAVILGLLIVGWFFGTTETVFAR